MTNPSPTLHYYYDDPTNTTPLTYSHEGDAGFDIRSNTDITLHPGEQHNATTGLHILLPPNTVGLVHPRSGLAYKHGITIVNAPGTIDSQYTGEIIVLLYNMGKETVHLPKGSRIAQIVVQHYTHVTFQHLPRKPDNTNDTRHNHTRGSQGFGSTGIN